jgi:hypothetical protein
MDTSFAEISAVSGRSDMGIGSALIEKHYEVAWTIRE